MELSGVEGINPGFIECYESTDGAIAGRNLWTHSDHSCMVEFPKIDQLWNLQKRKDNALSKKIREAQPIQMTGFTTRRNVGHFFDRVVDQGLIFVGDAAGNHGIIHGMISAYYGAVSAAQAVKEKNIGILTEYDSVLRASDIYKYPYCWRDIRKAYQSFAETLEKMKGIQV